MFVSRRHLEITLVSATEKTLVISLKRHLLPASTDKRMWDVRMRVGYQVVVP